MSVKVAAGELVLDALLENPNIKAAILVDDRGYVIDKRGAAAALKMRDDDDTIVATAAKSKKAGPTENLYLVRAGDDFLVVVFDDRLNFEHIKDSVDSTLGEFDLAPEDEDVED